MLFVTPGAIRRRVLATDPPSASEIKRWRLQARGLWLLAYALGAVLLSLMVLAIHASNTPGHEYHSYARAFGVTAVAGGPIPFLLHYAASFLRERLREMTLERDSTELSIYVSAAKDREDLGQYHSELQKIGRLPVFVEYEAFKWIDGERSWKKDQERSLSENQEDARARLRKLNGEA